MNTEHRKPTTKRTRASTPQNRTTTGFRISDALWRTLEPLYRGVWKLPAGTWIKIKQGRSSVLLAPTTYWSLKTVIQKAGSEPFRGPAEEAVEVLDGLLRESVTMRMRADVPVGAFLSGGLDSSTIVAMMAHHSNTPIKTCPHRSSCELSG